MNFKIGDDSDVREKLKQKDIAAQVQNLKDTRQKAGPSNKPSGITPMDILPSLSQSQNVSALGSPGKSETLNKFFSDSVNSAEEFFGSNKPKTPHSSASLSETALKSEDKSGPQYIQPKSRYSNVSFQSLVVDPKRENEDVGLPALKYNKSTTNLSSNASKSLINLSSLSVHSTSPAALASRARLAYSRPDFSLHSNASANSLSDVVSKAKEEEKNKEEPHEEELFNFNDLLHGRAEATVIPYGGFSNPDLEFDITNQENIFEKAPWQVELSKKGNISLNKAVNIAVEAGIMNSPKWVGTPSMPSDAVPQHVISDIAHELSDNYNCEAVFPNDITFQGHYTSFCKQILWPTFHYQIPDDPKSKAFEDHSWGHYKLLNQLVADKIVEVYKRENAFLDPNDPSNMIWVHDYHLLLVPRMIREKLPEAKIGLFLHISFPSSEVFRCFAQRKDLLEGMLGANSISFQTDEYVRHFCQTCNRSLLADVSETGVFHNGSFTLVNTIPVGINVDSLSDVLNSENVLAWRNSIRERWANKSLIVSRDKLDRLRGIKQKLLAYEKFLHDNPEYINKTVLIQICPGSVPDEDYESEVMSIVGRINSLTKDIAVSQPVILLQKNINFDQYLALQSEAELFVVSSMREGLNLTCHEFIVATTEKHSPLLLSEFTGSAPSLYCKGEGAILINPWDVKRFAELFKQLLELDPKKKLQRWKNCFDTIQKHDSKNWIKNCLKSINEAWLYEHKRNSINIIPLTKSIFEQVYHKSSDGRRIFILNLDVTSSVSSSSLEYCGDSVPSFLVNRKNVAFTEPSRLVALLNDIISDPNNHVYLVSFMKRSDLDILYKRTPNVGLIAENGGYIKFVGTNKWVSIVDEQELNKWMPQVSQLINSKVERLPGSHCEVEDCTIRFHAGQSLSDDNREHCLHLLGDCIQHINEIFPDKDGVHAVLIKDIVVVQQNQLFSKALQLLVAYYQQKQKGIDPEWLVQQYKVKRVPNSNPSTPIKEVHDGPLLPSPSSKSSISLLFLSGGSTAGDEIYFDYANSLKEKGEIPEVLTISISETDMKTSATHSVAGKNELLSILSNTGMHTT